MIVYALDFGCKYEGGGVLAVYSTKERAIEAMEDFARLKNKETNELADGLEEDAVVDGSEYRETATFKRVDECNFESSSDYISVLDYVVDTDPGWLWKLRQRYEPRPYPLGDERV